MYREVSSTRSASIEEDLSFGSVCRRADSRLPPLISEETLPPVHQFLPRANRSNFSQSTSSPIPWTAVNTNDSKVSVSFDQLAEYAIPPHIAAIQSAETCKIRNWRP